jgi:RPN1 N-terminal domain
VQDEVGAWGHEYVRNLAGEIGQEYQARREAEVAVQDLLDLVAEIVPYHMTHNAGALTPFRVPFAWRKPCPVGKRENPTAWHLCTKT